MHECQVVSNVLNYINTLVQVIAEISKACKFRKLQSLATNSIIDCHV